MSCGRCQEEHSPRRSCEPESTIVQPQCCCDALDYPHDPEFWHGSAWPRVWTRKKQGQKRAAEIKPKQPVASASMESQS